MATNAAPKTKWFRFEFGPVSRIRLYVNGNKTRYFIDTAKVPYARCYGEKHGLYGAGMSPMGNAGVLGYGPRIAVLKHRAEQLALGSA